LIIILAAVDGAVYLALANRASQSTDAARIEGTEIVVSSRVLGQVSALAKADRAAVAKGEALVSLDDQLFRAKEREALADRALADQNVAQAKAGLERAESDLQKAAKRLEAKVIPQKRYEAVVSAKASAEAQVGTARAFAELAEAQVQTAKAELEGAEIKSPIDGVVARKWVEVGSSVQPGQAIYSLYDPGKLWVVADFGKGQLSHIAVGDRAEVSVDAFPGKKFVGRVLSIGIAAVSQSAFLPPDKGSGSFVQVDRRGPVTIALENLDSLKTDPAKSLQPGMSARVRVATGRW
jgi:membrane fusion protein (multidrug efflux system)